MYFVLEIVIRTNVFGGNALMSHCSITFIGPHLYTVCISVRLVFKFEIMGTWVFEHLLQECHD